jgi:hypothetical protein
MKLYVNGDSHSAAAEAVNAHAFAEDDGRYFYLGRAPHPDNAAVSWPTVLGRTLKAVVHNDSESASSNQRILRTARQWVQANLRWLPETRMVIQWSTWERQEWLIDDVYYQINASGLDHVPPSHQDRYREYIAGVDWHQCTQFWHDEIWRWHLELDDLGVKHLFFNGNTDFSSIRSKQRRSWGHCYLGAYDPDLTYSTWLKNHGFATVAPNSWHFGRDAHAAWAHHVLQYGIAHDFWS